MADISDLLEDIAVEFADKVDLATSELVQYLTELVKGKKSAEALEILSGINLEVALELKLAKAFTAYEAGIVEFLRNTYTTTTLPENTIRLLLKSTKNNISANVTKHLSSVTMQNIIDGIATNKTVAETVATISQQIPNPNLVVNTAYNQFSNSLTTMLAEELPANTRWVYIGAFDSKTRQECRDKIAFSGTSGKTRKQILNRYGDMNNELYRCRHQWEQRSSSPEDQGYRTEEYTG
tara:strand:+ start:10 stop:720 length:711 start_codon:yes stop_codon:yes gene_type:complete